MLWAHEDSGAGPDVVALSFSGQTRQTFRLEGVSARDWEDMDVGPGPAPGVSYLYLGDIGDNGKSRPNITIQRVPEPAVAGAAGITAARRRRLDQRPLPGRRARTRRRWRSGRTGRST